MPKLVEPSPKRSATVAVSSQPANVQVSSSTRSMFPAGGKIKRLREAVLLYTPLEPSVLEAPILEGQLHIPEALVDLEPSAELLRELECRVIDSLRTHTVRIAAPDLP